MLGPDAVLGMSCGYVRMLAAVQKTEESLGVRLWVGHLPLSPPFCSNICFERFTGGIWRQIIDSRDLVAKIFEWNILRESGPYSVVFGGKALTQRAQRKYAKVATAAVAGFRLSAKTIISAKTIKGCAVCAASSV
jgi:hypothetical protein